MTLKITQPTESTEIVALQLEGRLTAETADQLRSSCDQALRDGSAVVLQLDGVGFADAGGVAALRDLERRGCVLVGCSEFVAALLQRSATAPAGALPNGAPDADEARLLQALRAGDAAAFESLVRRQTGPLLAAARRILANEEDARDAVQEAFISAYRHLGGFDGDARLSTWLHRIVVNAALMKLRSRRRRPEESIDDLLPCFDENGAWASGMAGADSAAETHVESRQAREMVRRCIARLPDGYRAVLVMRDIEDLDTSEVAEALGVTANAVKIRLHRARQALRTLIEQERRAGGGYGPQAATSAVGAQPVAARRVLQRETAAA